MYIKPTSPQPIGGVLDNGFTLYRHCLKETFVFAFAAALISAPFNRLMQGAAIETASLAFTALLASVVLLVITLLLYIPIVAKIDAIQKGQHLSAHQALAVGVRRFPIVLGTTVIYVAAVAIGFMLLVVPGIYVAVALAFALIAPVVEWKGVIESLRYSHSLVHGRWWRTAVLFTIITIVLGVIYFLYFLIVGAAVGVPAAVQGSGAVPVVPWYIDWVLSPLLAGLLVPLNVSLYMAVYVDLKLRREGADIASRIAAAEA